MLCKREYLILQLLRYLLHFVYSKRAGKLYLTLQICIDMCNLQSMCNSSADHFYSDLSLRKRYLCQLSLLLCCYWLAANFRTTFTTTCTLNSVFVMTVVVADNNEFFSFMYGAIFYARDLLRSTLQENFTMFQSFYRA